MFFSRPCQHAIRALVYLASHQENALMQVQEIARAEGLPAPALAAALKSLVRAGVVKSQKGPRGGFCLPRPAAQITLYQIMEALGDTRDLSQCVLGLEVCSDDMPCPVHTLFREIRQRLVTALQSVTVADLVQVVTQPPGGSWSDETKRG